MKPCTKLRCLLLTTFLVNHHFVNTLKNFQRIPQESQAKFLIVRKNARLINVNHLMKYGLDEIQCFNQCSQFSKCHSININSEQNVCVINYDVNEDEKDEKIICEIAWKYYEKEVRHYHKEEFPLERSNLIYTIPYWSTSWMIYFELKPKGRVITYSSILRLAKLDGNCCIAGQREPGILFQKDSTKIELFYTGDVKHSMRSKIELDIEKYHTVKVMQTRIDNGTSQYHVTLQINGILEFDEVRDTAVPLTDVQVYASDMYHVTANADIRNLYFENL